MTLRVLCGFGIEEITAFLSNKETINKQLYRAKQKLKEIDIDLQLPPENEVNDRRETVLNILYLMFTEGYNSTLIQSHSGKRINFINN